MDKLLLDERQMTALKQSVTHWAKNLEAKAISNTGIYADDCPLCVEYRIEQYREDKCKMCPVYLTTGELYCSKTPYTKANDAHRNWNKLIKYMNLSLTNTTETDVSNARKRWRIAARKEMLFLGDILKNSEEVK